MSEEELWYAWRRFRRGKRWRPDVIAFERNAEDAIARLSADLARGYYQHGAYAMFMVRDPKPRVIHKATVRDRVVHQALYDALLPWWERRFLPQSYGCRPGKGVHRAIAAVHAHLRAVGAGNHGAAWVLHGDIAKFFPSIPHDVLLDLLARTPMDRRMHTLCTTIVSSFPTPAGNGLPLGNLTSQLFGNVILHELDRVVVHLLRLPAYVRYADDFFIIGDDRRTLARACEPITNFLGDRLGLVCSMLDVRHWLQGVDVLGAVAFPWGVVPRRRQRIAVMRCVREDGRSGAYSTDGWRRAVSYLGMLNRTRSFILQERLRIAQCDKRNV